MKAEREAVAAEIDEVETKVCSLIDEMSRRIAERNLSEKSESAYKFSMNTLTISLTYLDMAKKYLA